MGKYITGCQCGDSFIGRSGVTCPECKKRGTHGDWCIHETHSSAESVDIGNGWIQYRCQFCGTGPHSALKDSIAGRMRACDVCLRKASASETLKRLKPIDDPAIHKALEDAGIYD